MAKFCANGHQMEDSWEICPYCQKTGFTGAGLGKTRVESDVPKQSAPVARKTVVLAETQKAPVVGWFVALDGSQRGEDFRVREGQNILGSDSACEIVINDSTVSARHASLRYKDGKYVFSDLDSTNGSYLNDGAESVARVDLKDNDVVRVGSVRLKFKCL